MILSLFVLTAQAQEGAYLAELQAQALALDLAESRDWQVLLHYERGWFRTKSRADGRGFFLDPKGKKKPKRELDATLAAFFEPAVDDPEKQHAQCQFPARYAWLDDTLDFDQERLPLQTCPRFEQWKKNLDVRSATLVFADSYLNSPASMFGHTFLRLDRGIEGEGRDLLANTVNFAAEPWTQNVILYPILGMAGGFPGRFSLAPYYLKVTEYNDIDRRALWEYPLDLDAPQRERLISHVWELGSTHFQYYYLNENCSSALLTLLDVADPSLRLIESLPVWALPTTTLRVVDRRSLLGQGNYRHSQYTTMMARRSLLEKDEAKTAKRLADGNTPPGIIETLPPERQAVILDAAIERLRYRTRDEDDVAEYRARSHSLTIARGALEIRSEPLQVTPSADPLTAHRAEMVGLGVVVGDDGQTWGRIELRPSLRDLASPSQGYLPGTALEMGALTLRIPTDDPGRPQLDSLRIIAVQSNLPLEPWANKLSWRVRTGFTQLRDGVCAPPDCLYYEGGGGPGLTVGNQRAYTYAFVDVQLGTGKPWDSPLGLATGGSWGALWEPAPLFRTWVEATFQMPVFGRPWEDVGAEYLGGLPVSAQWVNSVRLWRDGELRFNAAHGSGYLEGTTAFNLHF